MHKTSNSFKLLLSLNILISILLTGCCMLLFVYPQFIIFSYKVLEISILLLILMLASITMTALYLHHTTCTQEEFFSRTRNFFIANVSHEIRTPVNAITGLVHMLENTELSDRQKNLVSKINVSSDLLISLVNDILDLTKIRTGHFTFCPSNTSLLSVLDRLEGIWSEQIHNKGLTFITEYNFDETLCIEIDKLRIMQVLFNLISNSVKFTETGHIKISVSTIYEDDKNATLKFCVSDTGIGISKENLPLLFNDFIQIDNSLTKTQTGTGLGLSISKYIIENMGGTIWIESEEGVGSFFYFTIHVPKSDISSNLDLIQGESAIVVDGQGRRVLVAEDVDINFEVLESMLNDVNLVCDHAKNGEEAVKMCHGHETDDYYSIILMDIHMPVMDGYTASELIKHQLHCKAPILALTATSISPETIETYKSTIAAFVIKPVRFTDLCASLLPYLNSNTSKTENKDKSNSVDSNLEINNSDERDLGIINLGGSTELYSKHVQKFKDNYSNSVSEILVLLDNSEFQEAYRLSHSIKGLAGTLGFMQLHASSAELCEAISLKAGCDLSMGSKSASVVSSMTEIQINSKLESCLKNFESKLDAAIA